MKPANQIVTNRNAEYSVADGIRDVASDVLRRLATQNVETSERKKIEEMKGLASKALSLAEKFF